MSMITEHIQPMLDRKLPAALVAAFLLQTAGALFWAGQAAERITVLERTVAAMATDPHFRMALALHGFSLGVDGEIEQLREFVGPFSARAAQIGERQPERRPGDRRGQQCRQ